MSDPFIPPPPPSVQNRFAKLGKNTPERRRNAGSVKAGLPLIITGGSQRNAEFHYQFTEPGKFKKKNNDMDFEVLKSVPIKESMSKVKYRTPWNFCPDCNRTNVPREQAKWLGIWMVSEPHEVIHMVPGDTLVHTKCQSCIDDEVIGRTDIALPHGMYDEAMDEWRLQLIRANRMERNLVSFIHSRLQANDFSVVVSEQERESLGAGRHEY